MLFAVSAVLTYSKTDAQCTEAVGFPSTGDIAQLGEWRLSDGSEDALHGVDGSDQGVLSESRGKSGDFVRWRGVLSAVSLSWASEKRFAPGQGRWCRRRRRGSRRAQSSMAE